MPALNDLYFHDVRLKHLHLQNFRGFGNVTLDFHPEKAVTVLIADNGGGKSTILDAIAEFLRRFQYLAIAGKGKENKYETPLGDKDIFNERNNTIATVILHISYPFPDLELFQWINDCARWLDENPIAGKEANLQLDEEYVWVLQISQEQESITRYLPEELQTRLDVMVVEKNFLSEQDNFKVCSYEGGVWQPNLSLSYRDVSQHTEKSGDVSLGFEMARGNPIPIHYQPLHPKPSTYNGLIESWEANQGFITDYANSTSGYNRHNSLDESPIVLPLLVYYGGSAINAKYDNELKVPYRSGEFQAYAHALEPERFYFEEFLAWALWANEKQEHAWERVKDTILKVMNADQASYTDIQIEAQRLLFYKITGETGDAMPVEAAQLSAGEKNIMALVGDLAKRAVQLNAILFKVDFDPEVGTLSNPLQYTPGIVLIDEIDLHLHPRWQRIVIPKLQEHFPKVQFVVTTHSPFVLQAVPPAQRIRLNEGQPEYFDNEPVSDYEATLIDYFMVNDFFDIDTENKLKEFRRLLRDVAKNKKDKKDPEFVRSIKVLSEKGDVIKRVIAVELAQLIKND